MIKLLSLKSFNLLVFNKNRTVIKLLSFVFILIGCSSGGDDNVSSQSFDPSEPEVISIETRSPSIVFPENLAPENPVVISGLITYDLVPISLFTGGLDYSSIIREPLKGVTVRAVDESGSTVVETSTDELGEYSFVLMANTEYRIQVLSELYDFSRAIWDIRVTDNTRDNAIYLMEGSLVDSGSSDSQRNLHAPSGWTGSSYGETRTAAPFAILDSVYQALQLTLGQDQTATLFPLELRWSTKNRPAIGDFTEGDINTSLYNPFENAIYILGSENADTDEYDRGVVQHEFMHYLEDSMSRSNNLGGDHGTNQALDMRVAYSEGLANAFSAYLSGTGLYTDVSGFNQSELFILPLETLPEWVDSGWFNEMSVGSIIFDIADDRVNDDDDLSLSFDAILESMKTTEYIQSDAFTSIFLFKQEIQKLLTNNAELVALEELFVDQKIAGQDRYGTGETNAGGYAQSLPIYRELLVAETVSACTDHTLGEFNTLDNRLFLRFLIETPGSYQIRVERNERSEISLEPLLLIYERGEFLRGYSNDSVGEIDTTEFLESGVYVLEVYDRKNIDEPRLLQSLKRTGGQACFNVSIIGA